MIVTCPKCSSSYARVLLADPPRCRCGQLLVLDDAAPQFVDREGLLEEEENIREITRMAELVSFLIVATDCPKVDIEIKRAELKRRCRALFPDKMHVYEMIYASRFNRLWEQFRQA
jgi:hypothetical protein